MTSILIVDDHPLIQKGIEQILNDLPDMHVAGAAETGMQAINMLRESKYDVVLLDISLPDKHGMDVLKQIRSEHPDIKIIVLSMYPEDQYGVRALKAGAMGYISKLCAPEHLVGAIRQVMSRKKYISQALAEQLLDNLIDESQDQLYQKLSNREFHTLCLMSSGKSLTEIAGIMRISPKTVSVYRARMLEKMGFKTNAQAVHYAIAHHLVDANDLT